MSFLEKVQVTELLRNDLNNGQFTADALAQYFAEWKAMGPEGLYDDYYFGKDGFYREPKRFGRPVLQHVHLPPLEPDPGKSPSEAYLKWQRKWRYRGRKTSDTSLIYAHDPAHGYLLIYLAREPMGHEISEMVTAESREFMNNLADVAEMFIFNGKVMI